ncbi:MAG: hypothetical protein R2848_13150 [Thermomicrobiales bacterium]
MAVSVGRAVAVSVGATVALASCVGAGASGAENQSELIIPDAGSTVSDVGIRVPLAAISVKFATVGGASIDVAMALESTLTGA